jgi:hypothetical protein
MKVTLKIIFLLQLNTALLGCVIMHPDITPQPISHAILTSAPANTEAEIKDAKQAAGQLIAACQQRDLSAAQQLHTPERKNRQNNLVIAPVLKWCGVDDQSAGITLSAQYPYGQAVYFLYSYSTPSTNQPINEKHQYCLEMMKSLDGIWLANRYLSYEVKNDLDSQLEDCFLTMNKE